MATPSWLLTDPNRASTTAFPVMQRKSFAALTAFIATIAPNSDDTDTPYAIHNVYLVASATSTTQTFTAFKAAPFVDPRTGFSYFRARWYDAGVGAWLTPDPVGYKDSSNLYAFAGGNPVGRSDPRGEAVYVVYREFDSDRLRKRYPDIGHVFLAFDDEGLADRKHWRELVNRSGQQNEVGENNANPNAETFSFHPIEVCSGADEFSFAGPFFTSGACIDRNNLINDQNEFRVARAALKKNMQSGQVRAWRIAATQAQQEQLYLAAFAEQHSMNSGDYVFGSYVLLKRNCGSWVQHILEENGLSFPVEAVQQCNMGRGLGGLADSDAAMNRTANFITGLAIIYGEAHRVTRSISRFMDEQQRQLSDKWYLLNHEIGQAYGAN